MMTMRRFRRLLDERGADLAGWDETDREAARSLLAGSAEARALAARGWRAEAILASMGRSAAPDAAHDGDAAALARLRAGVQARLDAQDRPATAWRRLHAIRDAALRERRRSFGALAGMAALAGLAAGLLVAPPHGAGPGLPAMLQASPLAGLDG